VVRGLFVESKRSSYERLQTLLARWTDLETASCHGTFEGKRPIKHTYRAAHVI